MIGKRKRATEVAASIAQSGHVNFTRFASTFILAKELEDCKHG